MAEEKKTTTTKAKTVTKIATKTADTTVDIALIKEPGVSANEALTVKVKYFTPDIDKIEKIEQGDWIDLRTAEAATLKTLGFKLIPLGIAMELPEGYEAHVVPRSSTFKNFGIIQTNHMGIIDNSYCGDNDQWYFPAVALRDTEIPANTRICQFRIVKKQPDLSFETVEHLDNKDRGGIGSSGVK